MKSKPMINVKDVVISREFYQQALGFKGAHGGDKYERLTSNGEEMLQLHAMHAPEHPEMWDTESPVGNGVVFWFQTDDFDADIERIKATGTQIIAGPLVPKYQNRREFWFKDPDGYLIVIMGHNPG